MSTIAVTVTPNAKHNRIEPAGADGWRIWVTAAPADGQANQQVRKLLAKQLKIAPSRLQLIRGHKGKQKIFQID